MAAMTRTEFIGKMEEMVEKLKAGNYQFIDLEGGGYIFANQHYGEVQIPLVTGTTLTTKLFVESDEEKEESKDEE